MILRQFYFNTINLYSVFSCQSTLAEKILLSITVTFLRNNRPSFKVFFQKNFRVVKGSADGFTDVLFRNLLDPCYLGFAHAKYVMRINPFLLLVRQEGNSSVNNVSAAKRQHFFKFVGIFGPAPNNSLRARFQRFAHGYFRELPSAQPLGYLVHRKYQHEPFNPFRRNNFGIVLNFRHLAASQPVYGVRHTSDGAVMGNHQNGGSVFLVDLLQKFQNAAGGLKIQRSGGLIVEQELWVFDDGPCDWHALLLAAGQFSGETVLFV